MVVESAVNGISAVVFVLEESVSGIFFVKRMLKKKSVQGLTSNI